MKGMKVTLDTKVNKNQVANWRALATYNKDEDCLTATSVPGEWALAIYNLCPDLGKTGDYVTISFDAKGDLQVGGLNLSKDSFVKSSAGAELIALEDLGSVFYVSSDKYRPIWVTYKLLQDKGPGFFVAVRAQVGTLKIRNIKVELSDHPTDYVDYQGG